MSKTQSNNHLQYPHDWWQIATTVKDKANWTCQNCHIQFGSDAGPQLGVHHLDHNTMNSSPENLLVLCRPCHLRIEAIYKRQHTYQHRLGLQLSNGQLILPGFTSALYDKRIASHFMSPTG